MKFDAALLSFMGTCAPTSRGQETDSQIFGRIGGMIRSKTLTAKQRRESARKAALARWGVKGGLGITK